VKFVAKIMFYGILYVDRKINSLSTVCAFGGVVFLRTLFVYCSGDEDINSLCRESAFKKKSAKAVQLASCSSKLFLLHCIANKGKNEADFFDCNVRVEEYDRIIIACDEFMGELPPAVTAFVSNNSFRYKAVDCIVFGEGRSINKASDSIKMKVALSGGTVRSCICLSSRKIKREGEDLLFSVRHRIAV
jgi:hypothetical protein